MFGKLKLYAIIFLLVSSIGLGGYSLFLRKQNQELDEKVESLTIARDHAENNLALVSVQLEKERKARIAAQSALISLREIPNEDFNQQLPASIRGILSSFADSLRGPQ